MTKDCDHNWKTMQHYPDESFEILYEVCTKCGTLGRWRPAHGDENGVIERLLEYLEEKYKIVIPMQTLEERIESELKQKDKT